MGRRWVRQADASVRGLKGEAAPQAQAPAERRGQRHGGPPRSTPRRLVQAALIWPLCVASWAQSTPPTPAPVPDTPGLEVSDRVKRDAERPMYWIRRLGEQTAGQDKANQERGATERQNAADKAANEKAAERAAAERAARASRAERPETQAAPAPAAPPGLATRNSTAPSADRSASGISASPALAPASGPALAEAPSAAPGGSAPNGLGGPNMPVASASNPPAASDTPPPHGADTANVAMNTPTAPPAPAASAPLAADTLVLRPGESLALPDSLMRRMRRGSVEVKVQVAPDGSVMDATVVQSSHPRLDQPALEAIKAAHFQPVSRPTTAVIQFGFDLDS